MRNMKDSGIEWIGEIPEDWNICKLKNVAELYTGNSIKDDEKELYCDKVNAYSYIATKDIDVNTSSANYNNGMYTKIDDYNFKIAPKDSTLLCIEGGSAGKKITYLGKDVSFVNKLCCIKPNKINSKYQFYYLKSPSFSSEFNLNISGLIGGVSIGKLKEFPITLPSIEEQELIVDYLDNKVSEIDNIIFKTKETIQEYKKYKQSVITEIVTKGVNPNVEMKDSGIEWIGKIPNSTSLVKLKYLFEIKKDIAGKEGYDILSVTQKGIKLKDISKNEGQIAQDYSKYQLVDKNDFIMNHMDLLTGWVDCSQYEGVTSPDYRVFRFINPENQSKEYYRYLMQICYSNKIFYGLGQGVSNLGRWRLQTDKFLNFKAPVHTLSEQKLIFNLLDKKCIKIDKLISKKEQLIIELEQYKKSLIYECVTGKKEVSLAYAD